MLNATLLVILVALQIADAVTTYKGLHNGDSEANPIGSGLFASLGFWPTIALTKAALIGIGVVATILTPNAWAVTGPLDLMGIAVLWNNLRALRGKATIF